MAQNQNRPSTGSGLVGAIETREKERQQMKQGINSQAVQNAIAYRQQQAMQQQHPEHMNNFRAPQPSQYGPMSQYPQGHYPQGQQQQWVSPAANVYAQGGGFSAPSPEFGQQQTPPAMPYSPSQQYFNQQQRMPQQGGARGNFQGRQY
jgi:CCR4-NOT transcriptional complex subunit CAF120